MYLHQISKYTAAANLHPPLEKNTLRNICKSQDPPLLRSVLPAGTGDKGNSRVAMSPNTTLCRTNLYPDGKSRVVLCFMCLQWN